jgi:hypothetical protein
MNAVNKIPRGGQNLESFLFRTVAQPRAKFSEILKNVFLKKGALWAENESQSQNWKRAGR